MYDFQPRLYDLVVGFDSGCLRTTMVLTGAGFSFSMTIDDLGCSI